MNEQNFVILSIVTVCMALGAGVGVYTAHHQQSQSNIEIQGLLWPNPKQLQSFTTIDNRGEVFGLEQVKDKWSFMFFGFTHCPDICPITLSVLDTVKDLIDADANEKSGNTQTIFVSIDPERDTPEQLSSYVHYFDKEFIGLGGTQAQVQSLAGQIGVMYFRGETSESGDYLMDHSASIFLIDPLGRLVGIFSTPHTTEDIATRFSKIKTYVEGQM